MSNKKRSQKHVPDEDLEAMDLGNMSDSEDDYTEVERELLEKVRKKRTAENFDSEDEVYGLQDEDDEDEGPDSMESDIEGLQEDDDLPDEKAWGKKKRAYYSTDYVDPDYSSTNQQDMVVAEMEEQEARNIQKRLAEQLDDADFGLDLVQTKEDQAKEQEDKEQVIKTDLSKLSKRQKLALMQKESPEFEGLINDFRARLTEAKDILEPFLKLVKEGKCPECLAATFIETKYQLILNYCVNISFYLMLKAKRLPVNSHPVIKRLAQYRQLLNQLEAGQGKLLDQATEILDALKLGRPLYNVADNTEIIVQKKRATKLFGKKLDRIQKNSKAVEPDEPVEDLKDGVDAEVEEESEDDEEQMNREEENNDEPAEKNVDDEEQRRAITYQIAKNKGLTPHRKKEQRNPRVKHRNKFRKAKIRRKGAVREVRKEVTRYGGEVSGIKASVKKSIKLK